MNRQVTEPPPHTDCTASAVLARTAWWKSGKRSQVIAVSNVSDSTPMAMNVSRRYGARRNASRQLPTASPPPEALELCRWRRSQLPPWSSQIASAWVIHTSTSRSADSKPSKSTVAEPSPAPVIRASSASIRRQLVGYRPDWDSSRVASTPASKLAKRTPAEARRSGRGRTRTQASVISPRMPSEPISIRSGETPAPDPGSRRDCHTPRGVMARTASTRSSMCVYRVAKCPPDRVAIHPPRVEN